MNAGSKSCDRKRLIWPVAGMVIGLIAVTNPFYTPRITPVAGIAAWCADMGIVLIFSGHPIGARVGVLLAGLFLAVPCFLWATPLPRGMLMCFMGLPFGVALVLLLAPPIVGFRARLAHLCSWCGKRQVKRRMRRFDVSAIRQLFIATVVFAAAVGIVKATPAHGLWLLVRWLAGGIGIFAFAEMATVCHNFLTALTGLTVPPWFQSPYRSASVGEFWSKRWNIPTSELFRMYCFAPLSRRGVAVALFTTFLVSAIAHMLVAFMALGRWKISLICGAFFLVQPLLIAAERWMNVRRWPPVAGRSWTLAALAITSPLFVEPALQIVGKSWGAPDNVLMPTAAALGFVIVLSCILSMASLASRTATAKVYAS